MRRIIAAAAFVFLACIGNFNWLWFR